MASVAQTSRDLTTYTFKIVVEPDDDAWHAYCPALLERGGATWGETRAEAARHIEEVVRMVVASMIEHGEPIPAEPADLVQVSAEPTVTVIV